MLIFYQRYKAHLYLSKLWLNIEAGVVIFTIYESILGQWFFALSLRSHMATLHGCNLR